MATKKESIKSLKETAESFVKEGIPNKDTLKAALPVLIDLKTACEIAETNLKRAKQALLDLSAECSAYALKHETVFDEGLVENQQGGQSCDITLDDGTTYHFLHGYNGYVRSDGGLMTQTFLVKLPKEWIRSKVTLNVNGINADSPDEARLAKFGLVEKETFVWN